MSNRRKLHPGELARKDQRQAEARERARAGQTVIMTEYADAGQQCCWCDCPVVDTAGQPLPSHPDCDGCPEPAELVMIMSYGTPEARGWPICQAHQIPFIDDTVAMMQPTVVELAPPWEN
jgi:hypothetical protein